MSKKAELEPVQITVSGRNMPVTEPLRKYVVTKMDRLTRYLDRLSSVEVVLAAENTREAGGRNLAEATASAKGKAIRAECADADMYAAVDGLVDKLHLQLTKTKERSRDHKRRGREEEEVVAEEDLTGDLREDQIDDLDAENADQIVEVKQYLMKPMFSDEAIVEMTELGHAFFVFLNARTEKVSVVYRRRDGQYGLIEPAFA